jgi:hypothetical protein
MQETIRTSICSDLQQAVNWRRQRWKGDRRPGYPNCPAPDFDMTATRLRPTGTKWAGVIAARAADLQIGTMETTDEISVVRRFFGRCAAGHRTK